MGNFRQCRAIWGPKMVSVGQNSVFIGWKGNIGWDLSHYMLVMWYPRQKQLCRSCLCLLLLERSSTKHKLPAIYDQGETWSKNCNQRGNKGDGVSNWGYDVLEFTEGQEPTRSWPHLLNSCPVGALVKHEDITIRWYSDYNHTYWQYFALLHSIWHQTSNHFMLLFPSSFSTSNSHFNPQ